MFCLTKMILLLQILAEISSSGHHMAMLPSDALPVKLEHEPHAKCARVAGQRSQKDVASSTNLILMASHLLGCNYAHKELSYGLCYVANSDALLLEHYARELYEGNSQTGVWLMLFGRTFDKSPTRLRIMGGSNRIHADGVAIWGENGLFDYYPAFRETITRHKGYKAEGQDYLRY